MVGKIWSVHSGYTIRVPLLGMYLGHNSQGRLYTRMRNATYFFQNEDNFTKKKKINNANETRFTPWLRLRCTSHCLHVVLNNGFWICFHYQSMPHYIVKGLHGVLLVSVAPATSDSSHCSLAPSEEVAWMLYFYFMSTLADPTNFVPLQFPLVQLLFKKNYIFTKIQHQNLENN